MSESIDLSNLMNLQLRPDWVEDLSKKETAPGEVVWGRAPGARFREDRGERDDRSRPGGPRPGGTRGFDRGPRPGGPGGRPENRGPRPDSRGPRPEFRGGPTGQGDRRPTPREDRRDGDNRGPRRDDRGARPPFRGGDRREGPPQREFVRPLEGWATSLVPGPHAVESIVRQIKASGRAFAVFDVGRLFMKTRESYGVKFARMTSRPQPKAKEGEPAPAEAPLRGPAEIYQCGADGSLWLTREEAMRHILNSPALEKYYRAETVTVDVPKGSWNSVAVCGFSGALFGPPNHHDYQRNVARLHRERFSDMSLDRYKSRIRVEKDEALLAKWQEQLSSATHWLPVTAEPLPEGAEPPAPLKNRAEMEAHFLNQHAAEAVKPVTAAIVPGNIAGRSLSPSLLSLLRSEVEHQQRFPMQLVQDLCRALEGQGLRFFKRDKRNTFVCKNRPHFLPDDLVLSGRIRTMVEIVRANPGIKYSQLVSILAPNVVPATAPPPAPAPEPPPAETAPAAEAPVAGAAPVEVTSEPPPAESVSGELPAAGPVAIVAVETEGVIAPAEETAPVAEAALVEVSAVQATVPAIPAAEKSAPAPIHFSPEEVAILQDLRWLVQEGYVTEFQNGELFVLGRPPQPPAEKKPRGPRPDKAAAADEQASAEATEINEITAAEVSAASPEDAPAASTGAPANDESVSAPDSTEPPPAATAAE